MKVITKILVSVAVVLGSCVVEAVPASADEVTIDPTRSAPSAVAPERQL